MKRKLLQRMGDSIINNLNLAMKAEDYDAFDFFFELGLKLDMFCILAFDIYLD
jgi:hypothetical protein